MSAATSLITEQLPEKSHPREISSNAPKIDPRTKPDDLRDSRRKESFEKLISLTPDTVLMAGDPLDTKPYFAGFTVQGVGSYHIERTADGYKFTAVRIIDKEHHVNFSEYLFDKNGKFIEKVKTWSTGEKSAPDRSEASRREVDHIVPQLGAHNETWRRMKGI